MEQGSAARASQHTGAGGTSASLERVVVLHAGTGLTEGLVEHPAGLFQGWTLLS